MYDRIDRHDYYRVLETLVPKGIIWRAIRSSILDLVCEVLSEELAASHNETVNDLYTATEPAWAIQSGIGVERFKSAYGASTDDDLLGKAYGSTRCTGQYAIKLMEAVGIFGVGIDSPYRPFLMTSNPTSCGKMGDVIYGSQMVNYWRVFGTVKSNQMDTVRAIVTSKKPAHVKIKYDVTLVF